MENTRENAAEFLKMCKEATFVVIPITTEGIMVAYTERVVESACSAPSSIGEDEIEAKALHEATLKDDYYAGFVAGAKWAISRLSERKIVLPSEKSTNSDAVADFVEARSWNDCIAAIKRLNGIN